MKKMLVLLVMALVAFMLSGCSMKKYCTIDPPSNEVTEKSVGSIMIKKITLVQIRFLKTAYFGQHSEDGTLINPIVLLITLSLGPSRAYEQSFDPVIWTAK